ncbi:MULTISPECIES: poly-gamma-glutamate synthase PgsB [Streptomyces]|uniref:Poly-gamma-glutamate synthase PgsB n=2 Tax=Streptomyces TaxID=1883 RepID=A0ABU4KHW8_9ACTN|nr:poly-gamma-glutamate synthase PgsB [Streptomyces roseolus]MDX2297399.1 poly-gamma-glutamate synthase PgsB [Streptomyces roseolus]
MLYLYFVLLVSSLVLLIAGIVEQRRHYAALHVIPARVLVNGIRGKSSITRLCAGALRGGGLVTVAKTTGTAARFIHPDATEEPVYRKFGIANVVEQIGIVRRAAAYRPHALVIECMAVMPALQEVNQSKLIRSTIGVLCNVREDHLAEMGPTLDDVARSLCRSMPENGICVTAEKERFAILQEEADARNCRLVYADPESVTDAELRGFSWFTFKENVAIALTVAELLGVERQVALQGMYDAPPDPGVLSVERYVTPEGKRLAFANVFAANDPESTLMNVNQLLDLGAVGRPLNVVVNCRPDRVERNGQMGEIIPDLKPDNVFVIGHPSRSAIDAIPAAWRDRAVDLGGERRPAEEFMPAMLAAMPDGSSLVAVGNIHGQGEELLEYLAGLPADESPFAAAPEAPDGRADAEPHETSQTLRIPRLRIPARSGDARPVAEPVPDAHPRPVRAAAPYPAAEPGGAHAAAGPSFDTYPEAGPGSDAHAQRAQSPAPGWSRDAERAWPGSAAGRRDGLPGRPEDPAASFGWFDTPDDGDERPPARS